MLFTFAVMAVWAKKKRLGLGWGADETCFWSQASSLMNYIIYGWMIKLSKTSSSSESRGSSENQQGIHEKMYAVYLLHEWFTNVRAPSPMLPHPHRISSICWMTNSLVVRLSCFQIHYIIPNSLSPTLPFFFLQNEVILTRRTEGRQSRRQGKRRRWCFFSSYHMTSAVLDSFT